MMNLPLPNAAATCAVRRGILLLPVVAAVAIGGCADARERARRTMDQELSVRQADANRSHRLYQRGVETMADDPDEAFELFERAIETDPGNGMAWMALGVAEYERGNVYEAAEAFHRTIELVPTRYEPYFNLGSVFESVGRYELAARQYRTALRLAPDQVEVMENLARCQIRSNGFTFETLDLIERAQAAEHRAEWLEWLDTQRVLHAQGVMEQERKADLETEEAAP